jgi:hypothetical protein
MKSCRESLGSPSTLARTTREDRWSYGYGEGTGTTFPLVSLPFLSDKVEEGERGSEAHRDLADLGSLEETFAETMGRSSSLLLSSSESIDRKDTCDFLQK